MSASKARRFRWSGDSPRGLGQSGIGIARGKRYDGYLYLSGDPVAQSAGVADLGTRPERARDGHIACADERMATPSIQLYARQPTQRTHDSKSPARATAASVSPPCR